MQSQEEQQERNPCRRGSFPTCDKTTARLSSSADEWKALSLGDSATGRQRIHFSVPTLVGELSLEARAQVENLSSDLTR